MRLGESEYGRALFLLAKEEGQLSLVRDELSLACEALDKNPKYKLLLDTPAISTEEKHRLLDEAFGNVYYSVLNLLKILCARHAVYSVPDVKITYDRLYDEECGILRAEAVSAVRLTPRQSDQIVKKLSEMTGKTVVLTNTVDKSILGGMKLRYSGIQLDGSVKTRLDGFAARLGSTVI
jgi:F-type H+-transporting ATPase subunit delta